MGSRPDEMTVYKGRVWFAADDGSNGRELWVSDGTAQGTQVYINLMPAAASSSPQEFMVALGKLWFVATHPQQGVELWRTEGTIHSTGVFADIEPGLGSSFPKALIEWNDRLWFAASTTQSGLEIWSTDGKQPGATMLADIQPGPQPGLNPRYVGYAPLLVPAGERMAFFNGYTAAEGEELWVTDGTSQGTRLVAGSRAGQGELASLPLGHCEWARLRVGPDEPLW
jgi:ELWxxDGT repeat protein